MHVLRVSLGGRTRSTGPEEKREKRRRRIKRNRERVYSIRMSLPREQSKRKEENSDESRRERETQETN